MGTINDMSQHVKHSPSPRQKVRKDKCEETLNLQPTLTWTLLEFTCLWVSCMSHLCHSYPSSRTHWCHHRRSSPSQHSAYHTPSPPCKANHMSWQHRRSQHGHRLSMIQLRGQARCIGPMKTLRRRSCHKASWYRHLRRVGTGNHQLRKREQ